MGSTNNGHKKNGSEIKSNFIVGLDIGTSKICCIVASKTELPNNLNILGIGITDSEGLKRGAVSIPDRTVNAIKEAVSQAELQSGIKVEDVIVGISGDHIESIFANSIVTMSNPTEEITINDVKRVLDSTKDYAKSIDRKILHVIPQEYIIDGQDGIIDPIGMRGLRMEAKVNIITGSIAKIDNIYRCVERLGIKVSDIVLSPIASGLAVLDDEEKEVGVALVDVGGGTTDIAIYKDNILKYTSIIGLAGSQVTDDVREGLGIISKQAEHMKKEHGHTFLPNILRDDLFMLPGIHGRQPLEISKKVLCQIIQPRMEEIFELAMTDIRRSKLSGSLGAGIVLTGGCSLLKGSAFLAQEVFGLPVKLGIPSGISYSGLAPEVENPIYSTAVGLALYGLQLHRNEHQNSIKQEGLYDNKIENKKKSFISNLIEKLEEL